MDVTQQEIDHPFQHISTDEKKHQPEKQIHMQRTWAETFARHITYIINMYKYKYILLIYAAHQSLFLKHA